MWWVGTEEEKGGEKEGRKKEGRKERDEGEKRKKKRRRRIGGEISREGRAGEKRE